MGNNKKSPTQNSANNAHNNIMIRSKAVNNPPNGLLKSPPSQSSTSLFNRLSLSKLSPSHLMGGWPHKFLVNVQMLDDGKTVSEVFKKNSTGQDVFDYACKCLDIVEKEYFGLRYQDENNHRYWLDMSKPLCKQFRVNNLALSFRVRFYPENPACLREEVTRYQLFVQLQRDLLHGRLHLPHMDASSLAGLVLQSVLGDYDEELMGPGPDYVSEYKLLLKQSQRLEERISLAHQSYSGMTPAEAEAEFLRIACKADTYGFDPYGVKDIKQAEEITIGTTVRGILVFIKNQKIHTVKWREIQKVDYVAKRLEIYPTKDYFSTYLHSALTGDGERNNLALLSTMNESFADDKNADKKMKLKFVCPSATFAKHLWRHILSQQVFFTEEQARFVKPIFSKPRIPLFSRGSTFRCPTSRVLHEIEKDVSTAPRPNLNFERYTLPKQKSRAEEEPWNHHRPISVPSTPRSSRPSEVVANVDAGDRPKIFTGDGAVAEIPISTVVVTSTTTVDGDTSKTTTTISAKGSSSIIAAAETGDKEQQEAARCIMESSLDGLPNEHPRGTQSVEEELHSDIVPMPECSTIQEEEIDDGLDLQKQLEIKLSKIRAFKQQQNGGLTSKETAEELSFTSAPASFNANGLLLDDASNQNRNKQMDLLEADKISSGLSSGFLFSVSLCLLITLFAFLCYHFNWFPDALRYYYDLKS